jgi:hypothetical protein
MGHSTSQITVAVLIVGLGGCASSSTGLTTGSLGGAKPVAGASSVQPQVTMTDRVARAGTRAAEAVKCGYNVDPGKLKSGYLAFEGNQGASAEDVAKASKVYDATVKVTLAQIKANDDYCSNAKTAEIKTDISRHLAGDFSVPVKAVAQAQSDEGGLFSWLKSNEPSGREQLDPEWMKDTRNNSKTKRVE